MTAMTPHVPEHAVLASLASRYVNVSALLAVGAHAVPRR